MSTLPAALNRNTPGDPLGHAYDRAVNAARAVSGEFDDVDRKLLNIGWNAAIAYVTDEQQISTDPLGNAHDRMVFVARELAPQWTERHCNMTSIGWDTGIRYVKANGLDHVPVYDEVHHVAAPAVTP